MVMPTNKVTVALPFSKITVEEPRQELTELAAIVAELAALVEAAVAEPEATGLRLRSGPGGTGPLTATAGSERSASSDESDVTAHAVPSRRPCLPRLFLTLVTGIRDYPLYAASGLRIHVKMQASWRRLSCSEFVLSP